MKLIEGKKTKTGKITYLYFNKEGVEVSLLPSTAKRKGYKPVIKPVIKKDIKPVIKPIDNIKESKKPKEILMDYLSSNKSCCIMKNGVVIFTNSKDSISFEDDYFIVYDKKYPYTGIRMKLIPLY